jgi:hypothetical protein
MTIDRPRRRDPVVTFFNGTPHARATVFGKTMLHGFIGALLMAGAPWATAAPNAIQWELDVVEQGQIVDQFKDVTSLGQARTETASHTVQHVLNCPPPADNPATPDFKLTRTISLSPIHLGADDITFAIDTREMIEDPVANPSASGCRLPPEARVVAASHPGLMVRTDGSWTSWTVIEHDPSLVYRIKAMLAAPTSPTQ